MTHPDAEITAAAQRAAALYAAYYRDLDARRVAPDTSHAAAHAAFADTLSLEGIGLDAAVEEFATRVLPHAMATPHPLYLGLVNSSPLPAAPLADLLVSTINNNSGAFHQSPAATAAEAEVVAVFGRLLRQPDGVRGMVVPGGTFATLQALLVARGARFPQWRRQGLRALDATPRVYAAANAHFSIARSVQVLGLGEDHVVRVDAMPGQRGAMDPAALQRAIAADHAAGHAPWVVVASMGSTGTGALDPVAELAKVCRREDVWLHVDACYGGAVALLDELAVHADGLEHADSIAVDPHKWFFAPITAGLILTRHAALEQAAFALDASYIPNARDDDAFQRGVSTSRRGSALTVWLALRAHGLGVVRDAVRRNMALTRRLEQRLAAAGFRVLPGGALSVACARFEPAGHGDHDALQGRIAQAVVDSGRAWFATVHFEGRTWLRFNLLNLHTAKHHIDALAELVTETAHRLAEAGT